MDLQGECRKRLAAWHGYCYKQDCYGSAPTRQAVTSPLTKSQRQAPRWEAVTAKKKGGDFSPPSPLWPLAHHVEASFVQPVPNPLDGLQIRTIGASLNPAKFQLKPDSVHLSSPSVKVPTMLLPSSGLSSGHTLLLRGYPGWRR